MSDHAYADKVHDNIAITVILAIGIAVSIIVIRWMNQKTERKSCLSKKWQDVRRRFVFSSIGILPAFCPRPYGFMIFLNDSLWGGVVHKMFGTHPNPYRYWKPENELLMVVCNPGFYSGIIIGSLIRSIDWNILWSLFPGTAILITGIAISSGFSSGTVLQNFVAIGPTVVIVWGPYAILGYLMGALVRNYWRS